MQIMIVHDTDEALTEESADKVAPDAHPGNEKQHRKHPQQQTENGLKEDDIGFSQSI